MSYDTFLERFMPKNNLLRIVPRKIVLTRIRINLKHPEKSYKLSYNPDNRFLPGIGKASITLHS